MDSMIRFGHRKVHYKSAILGDNEEPGFPMKSEMGVRALIQAS